MLSIMLHDISGVTCQTVGFVMRMLNKIKTQQITNLTLRRHRLNNETRNKMRSGNNNLTCAPSENSDQPRHTHILIRVSAVHLK